MKNTNNPGKTKEVNNTSAAIGDTLTYTLTGTIANPAPTEFKFTDKPGKGLTIKASTFKFYVNGEEISAETAASDFTVPTADVTGGDNASFNVKVNDPSKYAGKTIKVTFQAVINDEADAENGVVNKLDNYGTDVEAPTKFTGFNFTKVDSDGKGIKDVTFQVKDKDGVPLYFVKQGTVPTRRLLLLTLRAQLLMSRLVLTASCPSPVLIRPRPTPSRKLCAPAMPTSTSCRALLCLSARRTVQLF